MALCMKRSSIACSSSTGKGLIQRSCCSALRQGRTRVVTKALFDFLKPKTKAPVAPTRPTVIPAPSYNIPIALAAISAFEFYEGWVGVSCFTAVLAAFLTVQTTRVSFVFDDEALEVVVGAKLKETSNVFVGGQNRWPYESFINWELWFPGFPVLVYFKESQTKPEGQIHFFPIIFDGKAIYDVMVERCGPSKGSLPKRAAPTEEEEDDD